MPGVDTDAVEVEFIGAHAVGGPGGQARAAQAGQVGAVRAGRAAAPEPVVPECEGFEVWQDIVWVDNEAVTPSGGHGDPSAGSQQLAPAAAGAAAGFNSDERGAPRVGVDGVAPEGDGGASPTGLLAPALIWVTDVRNDRERHQIPGERGPALGAIEQGHTSGSTVCEAGPSRGIRLVDRDDSCPAAWRPAAGRIRRWGQQTLAADWPAVVQGSQMLRRASRRWRRYAPAPLWINSEAFTGSGPPSRRCPEVRRARSARWRQTMPTGGHQTPPAPAKSHPASPRRRDVADVEMPVPGSPLACEASMS